MTSGSRKSAKNPSSHPDAPSEVAPGVFVGGWKDAPRFEGMRFSVRDEGEDDRSASAHIPVYDAGNDRAIRENLDRVARAIEQARGEGKRVLVFCGHGIRRSPLAVAWYLHLAEGLSLEAAYARIRSARPAIEEAKEWIGDTSNLRSA